MKKLLVVLTLAPIIITACKKDKVSQSIPTLTTAAITNLSYNIATSGGTITNDGGATITASGICWSKTNNTPTTTDSVSNGTTSSGSFSAIMNNLEQNTTYYVRAYATNTVGTGYGSAVTFSTMLDTTKVSFTYNGQSVTYGIIISTASGKKWLDRNLGASRVATSLTDTAAYGDLFEWGRLADGHQRRSSVKTNIIATSDVPGHSNFIYSPSAAGANADWRNPANDNLWQGGSGLNNPCPAGWHVPSEAEWLAETNITDPNSGFNQLKLVQAGFRNSIDGNIIASSVGTESHYWTSTPMFTVAMSYYLHTNPAGTGGARRANGKSVRCIKN